MKLALRAALGLLLAIGLVACDGDEGGPVTTGSPDERASATGTPGTTGPEGETFSGNGVSFAFPEDWDEFTVSETSASAGNELWSEAIGIDDVNFVSIAGYEINIDITSTNIDEQAEHVGEQMGALFAQAGGDLVSGPDITEIDGLPALAFVGTAVNPSGTTVESRLVLAFDGMTEYFVNCQYDDRGESEIVAGCNLILSTFDISA